MVLIRFPKSALKSLEIYQVFKDMLVDGQYCDAFGFEATVVGPHMTTTT